MEIGWGGSGNISAFLFLCRKYSRTIEMFEDAMQDDWNMDSRMRSSEVIHLRRRTHLSPSDLTLCFNRSSISLSNLVQVRDWRGTP